MKLIKVNYLTGIVDQLAVDGMIFAGTKPSSGAAVAAYAIANYYKLFGPVVDDSQYLEPNWGLAVFISDLRDLLTGI